MCTRVCVCVFGMHASVWVHVFVGEHTHMFTYMGLRPKVSVGCFPGCFSHFFFFFFFTEAMSFIEL